MNKDKKPIAIISNDWHLSPSNIEEFITSLIPQKIDLAKKLNVDTLIVAGDIFESRQSQRMDVLNAFGVILDMIFKEGLKLYAIPGNHDKTLYTKKESFLDPFSYHPALTLEKSYSLHTIGGVNFHFIPFFSTEQWLDEFEKTTLTYEKDVLISHISVEGSVNNDGSRVNSSIKPSMFRYFAAVYLGHYHNTQQIGDNVFHLPSIKQNNFGEDNNKGFSVIYDDTTYEIIRSDFKEYKKVTIDLGLASKKDVKDLTKEYADKDENVKFIFKGTEAQVKSIDKAALSNVGILTDTKTTEISETVDMVSDENFGIADFTDEVITDCFKEFCEQEALSYNEGINYLKKVLKDG